MQNVAAILDEILNEADALIRQRLKEKGIDLPHLVVGATPDDQIAVRTNGDPDVVRSFGEDLKTVADKTHCTSGAGRHDALIVQFNSRKRFRASRLTPIARKRPSRDVRHLM